MKTVYYEYIMKKCVYNNNYRPGNISLTSVITIHLTL